MKKTKTKNKILYFPPPKEPVGQTIDQAIGQTITVQAGRDRFVIHMEFEDLPPLPPVIQFRSPAQEGQERPVTQVSVFETESDTGLA
jgi:hypothetical protein